METKHNYKFKIGLYTIFLRRLDEINKISKKEIIPLPYVYEKLCRNFSISKQECSEILFFLRELGIIEWIPYHGIKVNFEKKEGEIIIRIKDSFMAK